MTIFAYMKKAFLLIFICFFLLTCQKDEEEWQWCIDCTVDDITGQYEGRATYVHVKDDIEDKNLDAYLLIGKRTDGGINLLTGIEDLFAVDLSGPYNDTYYINLDNYSQTFSGTITKHNGRLRITGAAKRIYFDYSLNENVTRDYIDIEVYQLPPENQ